MFQPIRFYRPKTDPWDVSALYTSSLGYVYDMTSVGNMWQDTARTTLANPGDPVASIKEYFTSTYLAQTDTTRRPSMTLDAFGVTGLVFDGATHRMLAPTTYTAAAAVTLFAVGIKETPPGGGGNILNSGRAAGNSSAMGMGSTGVSGRSRGDIGVVGITETVADFARFYSVYRTQSLGPHKLRVNTNTELVSATSQGVLSTGTPTEVMGWTNNTVSSYAKGTLMLIGCINRYITDAETDSLMIWLGNKVKSV